MKAPVFKLFLLMVLITFSSSSLDNPYTTLGVSRSAGTAEIRKAYKKYVRQYHPDKNKAEDASDKFIAGQEAYEVGGVS